MSSIYSYIGISNIKLEELIVFLDDNGQKQTFSANLPKDLVINMPYVGIKEKANSQLWLRDCHYYFKELLNKHPEYFSHRNMGLINNFRNPICDEQFVHYFKIYKSHIGETLVHHHIGGDGQAVAVPYSWHSGFGRIHNREKDIGITDNAEIFSEIVKLKSKDEPFSWDNEKKLNSILNDVNMKKNNKENNNSNTSYSTHNSTLKQIRVKRKLPPPAPTIQPLNSFLNIGHYRHKGNRLRDKSKIKSISIDEVNKLKSGESYISNGNIKEIDYPKNREPPKRHYVNTYYRKNGVKVKGHYKGGK